MKTLAVVAGMALVGISLPSLAHELTLKVDKVKNLNGNLLIAVYDKALNYSTDSQWVVVQKVKVTEGPIRIPLGDVPTGHYAVKLFQDENDNGMIDKDSAGIPIEPYGFSNNGGSYGQPSFDEAKVRIDKATEIEIYLK
ncbi:MAG: hypothetical protein B0W54_14215 [Cellvibrio sp. 79]|nr:MAG: hypothetical protein B0W54_14215 [Cellvibrio sp. 79]